MIDLTVWDPDTTFKGQYHEKFFDFSTNKLLNYDAFSSVLNIAIFDCSRLGAVRDSAKKINVSVLQNSHKVGHRLTREKLRPVCPF